MPLMQRILMVYSRRLFDRNATASLEEAGFVVVSTYDEVAAKRVTDSDRPDLIVLNMRLPAQEGMELVRWVRQDRGWAHIPMMMLAAQSDDYDKLLGLDLGADDYLTRPFGMREMVARVRAILRRAAASWSSPASLQLGGLYLDLKHQKLRVSGQPRDLTPTEFALLKTLMDSPGHAFTRSELIDAYAGARLHLRRPGPHARQSYEEPAQESGHGPRPARLPGDGLWRGLSPAARGCVMV